MGRWGRRGAHRGAHRGGLVLGLGLMGLAQVLVPPPARADDGAVAAELCGARPGCRLSRSFDAGPDMDGSALRILELSLPEGSPGPDGTPLRCGPVEIWLLRGTMAPLRLLHLCNDGYGVSGVGEDSIAVGPNRLLHGRYGGSAWRWSARRTWQLAPLELVRTELDSFHALSPDRESTTEHDRRTGQRRTTWTTPECGGKARVFDELPDTGGDAVPAGVALGTCAAQADSAGGRGFVVHGGPGQAGDARLWATVAGGHTLTVDIEDDLFVPAPEPGHTWIAADHLELWLSGTLADQSMSWDCEREAPGQWAVMLDGEVVVAQKGPREGAVQARVIAPGPPGRRRLELTLPEWVRGITVVYSDSDDGKTQERLLATSQLRHGDGLSLGSVGPTVDQRCVDVGGQWMALDRWQPDP